METILAGKRPPLKTLNEGRPEFVDVATAGLHGAERRSLGAVVTKPMAVPHQFHTYTELLQQIRGDLRIQHPEWIEPNGESPTCDSYEARLLELLEASTRRGSNASDQMCKSTSLG
jgi:hypothetical protein